MALGELKVPTLEQVYNMSWAEFRIRLFAFKRIELKTKGISTLKPRKIWFDESVQRLNLDGRGDLLGEFKGEDRLLIITQSGIVKTVIPELTLHFDEDMIVLEKWLPNKPISAIYFDGHKKAYYVKRFLVQNTTSSFNLITNHKDSQLEIVTTDWRPQVEILFVKEKGKERRTEVIDLEQFIAIKGEKALGNKLTSKKVKEFSLKDSLPYEEVEDKQKKSEKMNIELEITNENITKEANDSEKTDDEYMGGQITLEL